MTRRRTADDDLIKLLKNAPWYCIGGRAVKNSPNKNQVCVRLNRADVRRIIRALRGGGTADANRLRAALRTFVGCGPETLDHALEQAKKALYQSETL